MEAFSKAKKQVYYSNFINISATNSLQSNNFKQNIFIF